METETKQRQDINQGNATAWQTANNTTRKRKNKRETEISVRGAAAVCRRGGESLLELLAASEGREENMTQKNAKVKCYAEQKVEYH